MHRCSIMRHACSSHGRRAGRHMACSPVSAYARWHTHRSLLSRAQAPCQRPGMWACPSRVRTAHPFHRLHAGIHCCTCPALSTSSSACECSKRPHALYTRWRTPPVQACSASLMPTPHLMAYNCCEYQAFAAIRLEPFLTQYLDPHTLSPPVRTPGMMPLHCWHECLTDCRHQEA